MSHAGGDSHLKRAGRREEVAVQQIIQRTMRRQHHAYILLGSPTRPCPRLRSERYERTPYWLRCCRTCRVDSQISPPATAARTAWFGDLVCEILASNWLFALFSTNQVSHEAETMSSFQLPFATSAVLL